MTHANLERIQAADGYAIALRRFTPEATSPPRAIAIIAGAMGVKQDFYAPFAQWLATQGIVAYTFDYRGMAASRPSDGQLRGFRATISDWAILDCAGVIADASERNPDLPMYWLGHSVGAQIFGMIPNRARVQAMLSIAAGSGYWRYNARPLRYYVLSMWWVIMPLGLRIAGYFPGKRLGAVGDLPYGVAAQWRSWCLSPDYCGVEGEVVQQQLAQVEVPITALCMQDDELMTLKGTRALFALYRNAELEVQRVRPAEHGVSRIGHFGFFRANMQARLWPLVTAWIERMAQRSAHMSGV
jgi:predicted alpha/beta hydrolase